MPKSTGRLFTTVGGWLLIGMVGCVTTVPNHSSLERRAATAPWMPDLGNGTYKNPVIYADYSDPDVVRVGADFYLVASSFTCVPGLPILHSKDLVNWTIVGHALPVQVPAEHFSEVRNGGGVWAPAIRHQAGKYYIFYPDPDYGIYMVTATNPAGEWSKPILVKEGKGLIDPCPLWDDDGKVYLVHGWARSRSGRNNILTLLRLSEDATKPLDEGKDIIPGSVFDVTTLEGPKFYKLNGYYWIFAPVGGVANGPQAVFRARNVEGPYEMRTVLAQGGTPTNGPHQGGLVDTPDGKQWWFVHFQDAGAYGRITHLEPAKWRADGWPVMGRDADEDGTGEPVLTLAKPNVGQAYPMAAPQTSDEFNTPALGLQWQWMANPQPGWFSLTEQPGVLRLYSQGVAASLFVQPSLLLQKFPAPEFTVTTKLYFPPAVAGHRAGLVVYGNPGAWIGLEKTGTGQRLGQRLVRPGASGRPATETETAGADVAVETVFLRVKVSPGARCQFSYSLDGASYTNLGAPVTVAAATGSWIGAKFGLFSIFTGEEFKPGRAEFDWVRVDP